MSQITNGRKLSNWPTTPDAVVWNVSPSSWKGCTSCQLLRPVTECGQIQGPMLSWRQWALTRIHLAWGFPSTFAETFLELLHSLILFLLYLPSFPLSSSRLDLPPGLTDLPASSSSGLSFSSHLCFPLMQLISLLCLILQGHELTHSGKHQEVKAEVQEE